MNIKKIIPAFGRFKANKKRTTLTARIIGLIAILISVVFTVSGIVGYSYATRSERFAADCASSLTKEAERHADALSAYVASYDLSAADQKAFADFIKAFESANHKFILTEAFLSFKKDASGDAVNLFIKDEANKDMIGKVFTKFAKNTNQTSEVVSYLNEASKNTDAGFVYADFFREYTGAKGAVGTFLSGLGAENNADFKNEHARVYEEAVKAKKQLDSEVASLKNEHKAEISHRTNVLSVSGKYASSVTEAKALEYSEKLLKEAESYAAALSKSASDDKAEREGEVAYHIENIVGAVNAYSSRLDASYKDTLAESYDQARAHQTSIENHLTSFAKTAPNAIKKADIAAKDVVKAVEAVSESYENAAKLSESYASGSVGDNLIDSLIASSITISDAAEQISGYIGSSETAEETLLKAVADVTESGKTVSDAAFSLVHELAAAELSAAVKAVNSAETKIITAIDGIRSVYKNSDLEWDYPEVKKTSLKTPASLEEIVTALEKLTARAAELDGICADVTAKAAESLTAAELVTKSDATPFRERMLLEIGNKSIFIALTGILLLIAGLIALLIPSKFARAWENIPTFSTFITAVVMVVILTYAHGNTVSFRFSSVSDWAGKWLSLVLDVLRSNAFIGMVALGMTFVIITGGIDLAVGSTLAGIATVVMVILDVSQNGVFTAAGLTGLPNYVVAIAAGIVTGVGLGALTGVIITKGHVPPFIVTLGVMNIVRSVAQYFTKSIKISVPKEFQAISNAPIGDYILLPIIYWLILAVIMYVISKHTAFGRHIYAVGSNERTSRLSGINVDRVKISVYMLMGFIVAIAAVTQVGRLGAVDVASAGNGLEMSAIAAVVVGGTSMAGGRGSILGTILGVLIIGIMDKLVILLHIDAFLSNAFVGAIIIFAVLMQRKDK